MIRTESKEPNYLTQFCNGTHTADADVIPAKGGQNAGMGPHELLEASLACCINMWIRMEAAKHAIPVKDVSVTVVLKRDHPQEAVFEYSVKFEGTMSEEQRTLLLEAARDCPVRRTLLKKLSFQLRESL